MAGVIVLSFVLFRITLPAVLLAASIFRYNALSFIYLVCLLITPLLQKPSQGSMKGVTGVFLKFMVVISLLSVLGHIIFHVTLVGLADGSGSYGDMFKNCSSNEMLVRQIGYQRLDKASIGNIFRLVVPDAVVFITSVVILALSIKFISKSRVVATEESPSKKNVQIAKRLYYHSVKLIVFSFLQNLALAAAGVIVPSVFGAVYFFLFLFILTLWGCYMSMGKKFQMARYFLLCYNGLHILLLHLYQFQFFQKSVQPDELVARILGLTGVIKTDCSNVDAIFFHDVRWTAFTNPGILLLLYWLLAYNCSLWVKKKQYHDVVGKSSSRRSKTDERQVDTFSNQNETGSMVFSGSAYNGGMEEEEEEDDPGEEERLVDREEPPGGRYGGVGGQSETVSLGKKDSSASDVLKRKPWMSIVYLVMKQSYLLSLIAMMAWSITYHSWLTFVLLLAACFLWMLANSRKWCLRASPFILVYAELLLIAQYVFGMDLKDELPEYGGTFKMDEIGLKQFIDPGPNLGLQVFYTFFIVMSLRQFLGERNTENNGEENIRLKVRKNSLTFLGKFRNFLWVLLCKYWIFFCTTMFLVISLQEVVIYRIIYMIFLLLFIILFQVHYGLWRKLMYLFWWVVIAYSMLVLILIYTYQFENFYDYWRDMTGFNNATLIDIGLEKYGTAGLFVKLLTPTSFLIIIIIQVRYFHGPFLKLSSLDKYIDAEPNTNVSRVYSDDDHRINNITEDEEGDDTSTKQKSVNSRRWIKLKLLKLKDLWLRFTLFLWRLAEIHFFKVVVFVIILVAVKEVSMLTFVYILLVSIFMPFSVAHLLMSHLCLLWTVVVILAKMIFQLSMISRSHWLNNCTEKTSSPNETNNVTESDNAKWFGLVKIDREDISLVHYERLYIVILVVIAFESIVRYHQAQFYKHPNHVKPIDGILFPSVSRAQADSSMSKCIKFFANYFFYKFGLECCYAMMAITIAVRVDVVAVVYAFMLAILMLLSRRSVSRVWPIVKLVVLIVLPLQFLVVIGFPPAACFDYPWVDDFSENLEQWLFLPSYTYPPNIEKLIADFILLLLMCLQSRVFHIEAKSDDVDAYGGGDNGDILPNVEKGVVNPYPDFTIEQKNSVDMVKQVVFQHMYWLTMAIVFITGATRINIFSLFYVISVFYFMWYGKDLFLKPLRTLLRMWNMLILYCIFVLFFKVALQLVGCVYINNLTEKDLCWLVQLFGVNCLLSNIKNLPASSSSCHVEEDNSGMAWDVVCLIFLLIQRRIFASYYFQHVFDTLLAETNLVSKGAELINRIMIRDVHRQNAQEREILVNIKRQMMVLKQKQARLKKDFKEPEEHFQAIRAGDYYLFDHEEEEEEKQEDPTTPTTLNFGKEEEDEDAKPTPMQIINTAHDQGATAAIESYEDDEKEDEETAAVEPEAVSKISLALAFLMTLWLSVVDSLIRFCNRLNRNYRLVAKKLSTELVVEKNKILVKKQKERPGLADDTVVLEVGESSADAPILELNSRSSSYMSLDMLETMDEKEIDEEFAEGKNRTQRLWNALSLLLASRSDMLCFFLMILDQMVYGSLLSLPLPLMVFLWGMLSVPRPSKTFWVTIITYAEAVVVCKYLFQFEFFPWNDGTFRDSPFFPPRIIGIEKRSGYANVDIALLLALFIHRSILKKYGLWRSAAHISADLEKAGQKETSMRTEDEEDQKASKGDSDQMDQKEEEVLEEEEKKQTRFKQGIGYLINPFTSFFKEVTKSSYNATVDVYAPMFCCDFILFLVLVFGFSSFGPADTAGDGDVASYIQDNKIPVPFLIMLILQFVFIIVDRALFLRKFVLGKFIFQTFLVLAIHIWMFFILPSITRRSFFDNTAAQIWYFIKCIYFGLSAYQIRCGYPNRILGNFLTKNYNYTNLFLFKGFLAIPFLLELRALMDWIWTDSTLSIGNWLQMEDIYANVFVLKCWRQAEKNYPTERSIKKSPTIKYISGGLLLFVIIFIIWFPLVFFSFFNAVFVSNPPYSAAISISIGGYQPMFTTTALGQSIRPLTGSEFSSIKADNAHNPTAVSFLSGYDPEDVTLVSFDGKALSIWGISPVSELSLINNLFNNTNPDKLALTVEVKFTREPDKSLPADVSGLFEVDLRGTTTAHQFAKLINGTSKDAVQINHVYPHFVRLGSSSEAQQVNRLLEGSSGTGFSNISMMLNEDSSSPLSKWWDLGEYIRGDSLFDFNSAGSAHVVPRAMFVTFNDRKAPKSLSFLSGYGIIGLYISFILLIGRLLRLSTTNQYLTIMFRELPDVDRLLRLCLDLYLVREMKEFHLEEDLYASIVFLYRSPDTMVKFTRQTVRIGNIKKKED